MNNKAQTANSRMASCGLTCKPEPLCFYSSSVLVDSYVLRNPPERKTRNRYVQFMQGTIFISIVTIFLSCSLGQEEQPTSDLTSEKVDSLVPDTIVPITIEQSKISNPNYDPSTDPENKEMYKLFEPFVTSEFLNIEQVSGKEDSIQCFVNYIGTIQDLDLNTQYHVVSQYCTIQTANSRHGNSKVVFLNRELKYARVYYLESREQLPISTENNVLIFNYSGVKKGLQFKGGLPDMLCIPDSGCYE